MSVRHLFLSFQKALGWFQVIEESCSNSKIDKLRSFILSVLSSFIILYKKLHEKCTIKLLEIKNKILRIEKERIGEDIKAKLGITIFDLHEKYELYTIRKETYLT